MKILLDENVHVDFRHHLVGHDVFTVSFLGWKSTRNGALIARAAANGFDVLVTIDKSLVRQQNVAALPLTIVTMYPQSDALSDLVPLVPALLSELSKPHTTNIVEIRP